MKAIDLSNQTFGRWTVLRRVNNTPKGQTQWLCHCNCGTERIVESILLRRGITRSCGCLHREDCIKRSTKHGHSPMYGKISPTYHTWSGMVARCTSPKHRSYARYGGRGIGVCERWLTFSNFLADMGDKPQGCSIERKNNNLGYCLDNCRWADKMEQASNKSSNRVITFKGKTLHLSAWARHLGLNISSLAERLQKWPLEKALTTPKQTNIS